MVNTASSSQPLAAVTVDWQSLLFDDGELVGFKGQAAHKPTANSAAQFFCINPLLNYSAASNANVAAHRNFLLEMDNGSRAVQTRFLEQLHRVPFATKTSSGNKSLHYIIALTETLTAAEYAEHWAYMKWLFDGRIDGSCSNPSRLSRTPNAMRTENGKRQRLLATGKRITVDEFTSWLYGGPHAGKAWVWENLERPRLEAERLEARANAAANSGSLPDWVRTFDGRRVGEGNRHRILTAMAVACAAQATDIEQAEQAIEAAAADMDKDIGEAMRILGWAYRNVRG